MNVKGKGKSTLVLIAALIITMICAMMPAAALAEGGESCHVDTLTGWQEEDGNRYYYDSNGNRVTGLLEIENKYYYFDSDGVMKTGFQKIEEKYYYFGSSGVMFTGLHKLGGRQYYFGGDGIMRTGAQKIGKYFYYFESNGQKREEAGGISNGKTYIYYCLGPKYNGRLKTGWLVKNNRAFYYKPKNARRAINEKVNSNLYIGSKGYLSQAYALGVKTLNRYGWSLRKAYNYSRGIRYANKSMRMKSITSYATYGFRYHKGNCYVHASTFYIMARLLGYNAQQMDGKVLGRHGAQAHSWVVIKHKGSSRLYVYDLTFPGDGYAIWYGKKGTWRYAGYHAMR